MYNDLWKCVENPRGPVGAMPDSAGRLFPPRFAEPFVAQTALQTCSSCAGDYEDPDRTAWMPDSDDEDAMAMDRPEEERENDDEFPAQEA